MNGRAGPTRQPVRALRNEAREAVSYEHQPDPPDWDDEALEAYLRKQTEQRRVNARRRDAYIHNAVYMPAMSQWDIEATLCDWRVNELGLGGCEGASADYCSW